MSHYIGRFAPSPTGPLHIGSLIGALASYLDAKANGGQWLLRIEDLDPPREMPGAANAILTCLQQHGLQWDQPVLWQHQRHQAYQQIIDQLLATGQAFYCTCSRSDTQHQGGIYSGHCRGRTQIPNRPFAIRWQVPEQTIGFNDAIQGYFSQHLPQQVGDIVLKRKDGLFAYQLAVVVDDAYQQITHCVRGSDLLSSTPRQIALQQALSLPPLHYCHIPVITNQLGQKLSKQTFAPAMDATNACQNLLIALDFLQQPKPPLNSRHDVDKIIQWAIEHWLPAAIPKCMGIIGDT
ncbi:MAG: tRNA glutamyl-Q(34) synthetase GluQRS [Spongiibacteraceae bacterium]